jgi:hypothetical protein
MSLKEWVEFVISGITMAVAKGLMSRKDAPNMYEKVQVAKKVREGLNEGAEDV